MEWLIGLAVVVGVVLLIRRYYARPEFPPLPTDPNGPLMAEARAKARATLEQDKGVGSLFLTSKCLAIPVR
jgi:hypothetical protein